MLVALNFSQEPPIIHNQDAKKTTNTYTVRKGKLLKAITMAGIPLTMSIIIQVVLCYELYLFTESDMKMEVLENNNATSVTHMPYLQVFALLLWWVTMSTDVYDIWRAWIIVCSKRFLKTDGSHWRLRVGFCTRFMVFLLCVASELSVWVLVLFTGTQFIMYSSNIEHLVLNTLAVRFICEVDEIIAAASLPKESLQTMETTKIKVRCAIRHVNCWNCYSLYLNGLMLTLAAIFVTYFHSPYVTMMINYTESLDDTWSRVHVWNHELILGTVLVFLLFFIGTVAIVRCVRVY